ncbi:vanadium-dependent haloperoxidase [Actinokineospora enzanensis]|uniref:vanadium-dependent haloperoxidase n=1 Tax=Actinokineospora enzanensis TaxID=155975 RepID=UPI000364E99E|nr:vanadium-dependent haloperoxidase [Actinokineospora enzanensis]
MSTPALASASRTDTVLEWYDVTVRAVAAEPSPTQITNNRTWAIGWLAATRAVRRDRAVNFADAALATAVHDSLVGLVANTPARKAELDSALANTLARIPDGRDKSRGIAEGSAQARRALAERTDDGLEPAQVNAPVVVPNPAPGVWQPTPPAYSAPIQSGNRTAKPYLLHRADQFRPPAPPALDSARYRADLAEVEAYGSATSTVRTQAQTDVASFWYQGSQTGFLTPLRAALQHSRGSLADRVRLVAEFNVIAVDTQIATSDAKFAYWLWRPVTAIRAAGETDWTPLHVTPAHPDYPSGHATYAGFAEQVLTALTGPKTAPFTQTSPTAPGLTFTYRAWTEITRDTVNARVWSGIHTRLADEVGVRLGKDVARYELGAFDRLLR